MSGSALIRTPELAADIIAATKEAGLPVSVKARLGDKNIDEWQDWLGHLLKQDIANLTIHLRTRKEMSKVEAHFELIPAIKALRDDIAPQTLLTINGDIQDRQHGLELVKEHDIDGIMIGRGVFKNPFAFADDGAESGTNQSNLLELLNYHLDLFDKNNTPEQPRRYDPLKRFFKIYLHSFPGAAEVRESMMKTKSTDEARELLKLIVDDTLTAD